jgi:hypothetical protein
MTMKHALSALAVVAALSCVSLSGAAPSGPLDAAKLAQLETELSRPICGVGYLDSRQGQLDAIEKIRPLPYLEHMARAQYGKDRRWLPGLAIQLLGRAGSARAAKILRALVRDSTLDADRREIAARELATKYKDGTGRDMLVAGLDAPGVQRRADSFSALVEVLRDQDLPAVMPLAQDTKFYAVERFVTETDKRPRVKARVLPRLAKSVASASGDVRGRLALTGALLGVPGHLAIASQWLTQHPGAAVNDDLYQLGQMCHALARRGHREGLDAALHLARSYRGPEPASWKRYVLDAFFTYAEPPPAWRELDPSASLPKLAGYWKQQRSKLRFNTTTKRFE